LPELDLCPSREVFLSLLLLLLLFLLPFLLLLLFSSHNKNKNKNKKNKLSDNLINTTLFLSKRPL
jgi:TRAP-type mannitol/chloroaromatic compound transport system permease small subunit